MRLNVAGTGFNSNPIPQPSAIEKLCDPDYERIAYDVDESVLLVRYPDRQDGVGYNDMTVNELDLCYATTIHKSQGSEYDTVIIVVMPSSKYMFNRKMFYTAVTRAKKRCVIVGDWECIKHAVSQWNDKRRYTGLRERIANPNYQAL